MKNKKLMACILSLFMMVNGLTGRTSKNNEKKQETTTVVSELPDEEKEEVEVEIGSRKFYISQEYVKYIVKKGDIVWDISRDLNLDEKLLMEKAGMSTDLIFPDDEIIIPMEVFKDINKKTGIQVSEENGDINWDVVRYFTDFALITVADYEEDRYGDPSKEVLEYIKEKFGDDSEIYRRTSDIACIDSNFETNIKECKLYEVPCGVNVYGDLKSEELEEASLIGKQDAEEVISILSGYEIKYPVMLTIDEFDVGGLSYFAERSYWQEDTTRQSQAEDYCLAFLKEIKDAGYYPIICLKQSIYKDFVKLNDYITKYDKIFFDTKNEMMDEESQEDLDDYSSKNMSLEGTKYLPGIELRYFGCPVYVDNTSFGMEKLISGEIKKDEKKSSKKSTLPIIIGGLAGLGMTILVGPSIYINVADLRKKEKKKIMLLLLKKIRRSKFLLFCVIIFKR